MSEAQEHRERDDLTARIEQLNRRIAELQREIERISRRDPPRR